VPNGQEKKNTESMWRRRRG